MESERYSQNTFCSNMCVFKFKDSATCETSLWLKMPKSSVYWHFFVLCALSVIKAVIRQCLNPPTNSQAINKVGYPMYPCTFDYVGVCYSHVQQRIVWSWSAFSQMIILFIIFQHQIFYSGLLQGSTHFEIYHLTTRRTLLPEEKDIENY